MVTDKKIQELENKIDNLTLLLNDMYEKVKEIDSKTLKPKLVDMEVRRW